MTKKQKKSYSTETKYKAIEMRLSGYSVKQIMQELEITNESQIYTWYYWYRDGEFHRLEQPIGKQYTYGHSAATTNGVTLEQRNQQLEVQNSILKKYLLLERRLMRK